MAIATSIPNVPGGLPSNPGAGNTSIGESTMAFDTTTKTLKIFDGTALYEFACQLTDNAPVNCTASTLTVAAGTHAFKTVTLNRSAGITVTLPAAAGTGDVYRFIIGTAGATVLNASTNASTFVGGYVQNDTGDSAAATADFMPAASGNNTYTTTTAGGGAVAGDWFEVVDIASTVYAFRGMNSTATDPTNRFSTV